MYTSAKGGISISCARLVCFHFNCVKQVGFLQVRACMVPVSARYRYTQTKVEKYWSEQVVRRLEHQVFGALVNIYNTFLPVKLSDVELFIR